MSSPPSSFDTGAPRPAISYQRLRRLFEHLFGLSIGEGALDALFRRAKPAFNDATSAILGRLRRSRMIVSLGVV